MIALLIAETRMYKQIGTKDVEFDSRKELSKEMKAFAKQFRIQSCFRVKASFATSKGYYYPYAYSFTFCGINE